MIPTLVSLQELPALAQRAQAHAQKVVLANGAFDLLHVGHIRYLQAAKACGHILVVAVNSDASVRASKGPLRPVVPQNERVEMLLALRCVDYAVLFDSATVEPVIQLLKPHVHAKGTDYTENSVPEGNLVRSLGGVVKIVGDPKNHSTTQLIQHLERTHDLT
jgi:rfaE bifunctional protein nucleotidyltransferase chain/domain